MRSFFSKINLIVLISFTIFFSSSVYRHYHYGSNALDLGVFDQALWILSTGQTPILSIIGKHVLADHGSWMLYPLSILYKIYPTVLWLFFIQSLSFSYGAKVIHKVSIYLGASNKDALLFSLVYLLTPSVFGVNSFDFHPDTLAFCMMLLSVEFIFKQKLFLALLMAVLASGCKEFYCFAILGVGIYFLTKNKYLKVGIYFIVLSAILGVFSIVFFIPYFAGGAAPSGTDRFFAFGKTPIEILFNILLHPVLFLSNFNFRETYAYLFALAPPFVFLFHYKNLKPFLGMTPVIILYALSDCDYNRNIYYQYALIPLLFFILIFFEAIITKKYIFKNTFLILLISLFCLVRPYYRNFMHGQYDFAHNWKIKNHNSGIIDQVVLLVPADASIIAPSNIVPRFSQREKVYYLTNDSTKWKLSSFNYILLVENNEDGYITPNRQNQIKEIMEANILSKEAEKLFQEDGVLLYRFKG